MIPGRQGNKSLSRQEQAHVGRRHWNQGRLDMKVRELWQIVKNIQHPRRSTEPSGPCRHLLTSGLSPVRFDHNFHGYGLFTIRLAVGISLLQAQKISFICF